ncbi:MAG: peptide chain release factor 1 [Nitrospirales bacterium]|nr:peptide chain release factor 1 [Nitrospira sp.]MDR4500290.1 peptide chain release factor 1 [Nitrospirales bacterium]
MAEQEKVDNADRAFLTKWEAVANRYDTLNHQFADPSILAQPPLLVSLNKERAEIEEPARLYQAYQVLLDEITNTQHMLEETSLDRELRELAQEELQMLHRRRDELEMQAQELLRPRDAGADRNTFIEIRAGAGGSEAALWAGELLRMYTRFAEEKGLHAELVEAHETGIGGYKDASLLIEGKGAYGFFKHESGVHRVQRVPETEASGRIHTSTATVAVMPEVEEVDVHIDPKDLRIDTYCSSGAGGQSVNTTYSAIRITHLPTGVVVTCQDERSQLKNRNKAMRTLRTRIVEAEREKQEMSIAEHRRSQVGTGDRSEKIRTYNFPQNRVTDHRIGLSLHKLERVLEGELDELIEALSIQ